VAHQLSTIAFPAISCGVYGYPIEKARKIAIDTTYEFLNENPSIQQVSFVLFSERNEAIYRDYLDHFSI
jgi:O-acetyl-ADP-ribose deacetylase (regulator of RNase III)